MKRSNWFVSILKSVANFSKSIMLAYVKQMSGYKPLTWIYKNLTIEVNATLLNREAEKYDSPLKDYLERFVEAIYPLLRGYQEQVLRVHLNSNDILEIQVELNGEWSSYTWIDESFKGLLRVEKEKNTESQIKFKLFASE